MKVSRHRRRIPMAAGFTLIELMIALAVLAILAGIGYPSYTAYVLKSARTEAKAILMETTQDMERYYTTNNTYDGATVSSAVSPKGATGSAVRYRIGWSVTPTATAYAIQAVPANAQASDSCGTLTLTQTGARSPSTAGCW